MATRPPAPKGLGTPGKALWKAILGDLDAEWELDARELHLLERACRCEDELRILEAAVDKDGSTAAGSRGQVVVHPAVSEARQLRLVQLRLLGAIETADPVRSSPPTSPSARGQKAAAARWRGHEKRSRSCG